jgi:hypothetical protein
MQELGGIQRQIRRIYYAVFRRDYINESLKHRAGSCKMCSCCPTRLFSCRHYNYEKKKCTIWEREGFEAIPYFCRIYPFDEKDKSEFARKHCGYFWDNGIMENRANDSHSDKR